MHYQQRKALMYFIYSLLLVIILFIFIPFLPFLSKRGNIRGTLKDRFGLIDFSNLKGDSKRIWVHAASVGEARTALELIRALKQEVNFPVQFVFSVFTKTGYRVASGDAHVAKVFYLPIDLPVIVNKVIRRLSPDLLIIMETELWPNLIRGVHLSQKKIIIANARISGKSFNTYRRFMFFMRHVFRFSDRICVQNEVYRQRYLAIGAKEEQITVCGDIKDEQALSLRENFNAEDVSKIIHLNRRVVISAVSTHPGEEEAVCQIYKALRKKFDNLLLIIAPRHVDRAEEILEIFRKQGISYLQRSKEECIHCNDQDVILWDSFGELGFVYFVSEIVFVGGSLVPIGGHSLMEPAAFGKPVLWGSFAFNFIQAGQKLKERGGGIQIDNIESLESEIQTLLEDPQKRKSVGQHALESVLQSKGAVERHLKMIKLFLDA
jgi:3-deoxy-D-manno-octulosonic-acid transferase